MKEEKKNIYEKIQFCRVELQNKGLKKSGENKFAKFNYFELGDFIPTINELFNEVKLFSMFNIKDEVATLTIIDSEDTEKQLVFESPIASADLKGCTPIQSLGGIHTYMRRYLYLNALEIAENDLLDAETGKQELPTKEKALEYELTFGKHKGKKLGELLEENINYLEWLRENKTTDEYIKQCLNLILKPLPTPEEQDEILGLITELNKLLNETNTDREKFYKYYEVSSNSEMTLEQLKDGIEKLTRKVGE